jgi:two-component system phosphate regulon response regulator OmpR
LLKRFLSQEGFEVLLADSGSGLDRALVRDTMDLIVLDLMMPGEDGLSICRRLRAANDQTPIIMLTAKGEDVDRIAGLEVGADDYLGKPFNPRELLARISAVLRRRPTPEIPAAPSTDLEIISFGPFTFDLGARTLRRGEQDLPLTSGEFAMLKALVRHPRQPLSRARLAQLARGREFSAFDRSLDVQVSRLRKLLEHEASTHRYIQTVWGVGYVFVPDSAAG